MLYPKILIASAMAVISIVQASPLEARQSGSDPPARYHLQTQLRGDSSKDDCGSPKGGLWLYSYHTGAGLGDAVLDANESSAMEAYYDRSNPKYNGQQFFAAGNNAVGPWPLVVSYGAYQSFQAVTISVASEPDSAGYYFNSSGLQWNSTSFGGWLVCDWWHAAPQLFAELSRTYGDRPKTCSEVNLLPVGL